MPQRRTRDNLLASLIHRFSESTSFPEDEITQETLLYDGGMSVLFEDLEDILLDMRLEFGYEKGDIHAFSFANLVTVGDVLNLFPVEVVLA